MNFASNKAYVLQHTPPICYSIPTKPMPRFLQVMASVDGATYMFV